MGFFHEYYGHLFGRAPDGPPEVRFNRELEYRPYDREDLEMVHEAGVSMTNMMRLMTSPGGLGTLHLLVAVERLHRFRDPSGFRDEQLKELLETVRSGRGTEENVRAFRAALASRDVLRLRFIHDQCTRAAAELSRLPEPEDEDDDDDDWEEPVILEDPEEWEELDGDLW